MVVEDIVFDNISICMDDSSTEAGQPAMSPLAPELCRAGFRIRNARDVKLRAIDIRGHVGPAVMFDTVTDAVLRDLSGGAHQWAEVHVDATSTVRGDDSVRLVKG
jgi:hypothetical protein